MWAKVVCTLLRNEYTFLKKLETFALLKFIRLCFYKRLKTQISLYNQTQYWPIFEPKQALERMYIKECLCKKIKKDKQVEDR